MHELSILLDRLVPEALESVLKGILGSTVPCLGEGDRYRIRVAGRFSGRHVGSLLAQLDGQDVNGALVLVEEEVRRVLYVADGLIAAASSSVLFERLGRLLHQAGALDDSDSERIVEVEEREGVGAAAALLPPEAAAWALEQRIREVVAAVYFMAEGHYVFVEGQPQLGDVPVFALAPQELAMEGMRRYDEWRNRSSFEESGDETMRVLWEAQA